MMLLNFGSHQAFNLVLKYAALRLQPITCGTLWLIKHQSAFINSPAIKPVNVSKPIALSTKRLYSFEEYMYE